MVYIYKYLTVYLILKVPLGLYNNFHNPPIIITAVLSCKIISRLMVN